MNEENKNPVVPDEEINTDGNTNEDAALNEELEALRDTFQEKYDESVEEAVNGPVIQELEEGEAEEEEPEEENEEPDFVQPEKKPKKKKKLGKIIAITIPVLLVLVVIGSLLAYVVASMTNPNFSSFISTYAKATASEEYDEKIGYLEDALEFCSDEDSVFQQAMANTILEEIVVAVYNEEGYASAYSYIKSNMTDEQTANPVNPEFKKILSVIDDVNKSALSSFEKVIENLGELTEVPNAETLSAGISVPEEVKETFNGALVSFAEGYLLNKKAEGITESLASMNYYAEAYSALTSIGADSRELAEKLCVDLYNNGYVIEAASLATVAVNPENEIVRDDFSKMKEAIAVYGNIDISVIELAQKAVSEEKTDAESVTALVKSSAELSDDSADIIAAFVLYAIEGIKAENEHNLTQASSCYATLTSVLDAFGMADTAVHLKTAEAIFNSGNLADSETLVTQYLTEELMADATEEQKALRNKMVAGFEALAEASNVFSPYYSAYYQSGTPMDYDEVSEALNKLITEDADNYLKGFVNYCLYFAAKSSDEDRNALPLVDAMAEYMPDLVFLYGYYYIDEYIEDNNFSAAKAQAEKLLQVNIADEYANSIISLIERVNGNLEASVETALKGIELAGSSSYCGKQLAIAYMLQGDFESAYGYVSSLYSNNMSVDSCDLMLVFNKLYDGDDAEIKAELEAAVSEIEQTYSYYGVTSYQDTLDILKGEKTLRDVFAAGDYDLTDD